MSVQDILKRPEAGAKRESKGRSAASPVASSTKTKSKWYQNRQILVELATRTRAAERSRVLPEWLERSAGVDEGMRRANFRMHFGACDRLKSSAEADDFRAGHGGDLQTERACRNDRERQRHKRKS